MACNNSQCKETLELLTNYCTAKSKVHSAKINIQKFMVRKALEERDTLQEKNIQLKEKIKQQNQLLEEARKRENDLLDKVQKTQQKNKKLRNKNEQLTKLLNESEQRENMLTEQLSEQNSEMFEMQYLMNNLRQRLEEREEVVVNSPNYTSMLCMFGKFMGLGNGLHWMSEIKRNPGAIAQQLSGRKMRIIDSRDVPENIRGKEVHFAGFGLPAIKQLIFPDSGKMTVDRYYWDTYAISVKNAFLPTIKNQLLSNVFP